jgi:hypothetical protein
MKQKKKHFSYNEIHYEKELHFFYLKASGLIVSAYGPFRLPAISASDQQPK